MSHNISDMAEELTWEQFEVALDDYDFNCLLEETFLDSLQQFQVWKLGQHSSDMLDYKHIFSILWDYDCVGLCLSPIDTLNEYKKQKIGW